MGCRVPDVAARHVKEFRRDTPRYPRPQSILSSSRLDTPACTSGSIVVFITRSCRHDDSSVLSSGSSRAETGATRLAEATRKSWMDDSSFRLGINISPHGTRSISRGRRHLRDNRTEIICSAQSINIHARALSFSAFAAT